MSEGFERTLLKSYEERGLLRSQTNGTLTIYNYTEQCAYDREWDEVTLTCRGFIQDNDDMVVARPFRKFFNLGEHDRDNIPFRDPYLVQDKLDGSLVITALYDGQIIVATRGSFESEQAIHARQILRETYPDWFPPDGWTVLFEVVYPANRIVVDYGTIDDLILLGAVNNETGEDWPLDGLDRLQWPGMTAPYQALTIPEIERMTADPENGPNREGFVIVWPIVGKPSFRLKCKFAQYVMLHKVVTGLSTTVVWESLATNDFAALVELVPDEWYNVVQRTAAELIAAFNVIADEAEGNFARVPRGADRKAQAELIKEMPNSGLVFAMLDGKDVTDRIWKLVKPEWHTLVPLLDSTTEL